MLAKGATGLEMEMSVTSRWDSMPSTLPAAQAYPQTRLFTAEDAKPIYLDLTLWDLWPIQLDDGMVAQIKGGELWIILSAPRREDPDDRHNEARMRLFHRIGNDWRDCGNLLSDGFSPGSREWSGSARLEPASSVVTLWFTAAGNRAEQRFDFEQRLFQTEGVLDVSGDVPAIGQWSTPTQSALNDGSFYADLATNQGVPGRIKGFRDPYWFRDPADGQGYILFTGSKSAQDSQSDFDGVIGIARANDINGQKPFTLLPPLIDGDGQSNELEVPHVIVHDGRYYLFWSSQKQVFAPGGLEGPTALYGMVADSLFGPYAPLNGSGLVLANPISEPRQAYAWKVLPNLEVASFVDYWGLEGRDTETDATLKARQFGGTIAPMARIALDGNESRVLA